MGDVPQYSGPILHVIVVGFHHKKGCQVEYSYPPLIPDSSNDCTECPGPWKYLPTLALPDGSHNYQEDTVIFHLPSLTDPKQTIFGISCFRQIAAEKLRNKTADITRGTVQKSVCVLSTIPLYGHIQVKMALITHAYFKEGDFSQVSLLQETYSNLNNSLNEDMLCSSEAFVGLPLRSLVMQFRHKVLLLFKLILLEKRLLFFKSPVWDLCTCILSVLSLFPEMIETGLTEAACFRPSRPMSPVPEFTSDSDVIPDIIPSKTEKYDGNETNHVEEISTILEENKVSENDLYMLESDQPTLKSYGNPTESNSCLNEDISISDCTKDMKVDTFGSRTSLSSNESTKGSISTSESLSNISTRVGTLKGRLSGALNYWGSRDNSRVEGVDQMKAQSYITGTGSVTEEYVDEREALLPNLHVVMQLDPKDIAMPLNIFTKGYLCFPYLSLPYLDLLSDVNVRGYILGATNVLFKQKKNLADVVIEVNDGKLEFQSTELRRQLHLTTEDLRFADYIVRHVSEEKHDVFLDGVGWEGSDEWIRTQFKLYLLSLLRTSLLEDGSREMEYFGSSFMMAWKTTHNYKMWEAANHLSILEVNPGHPFAGQLSMADMKLRFSHTMQTTESGRKLNQAVSTTGKAVVQTSRVVGDALSQARGAISSWWSTINTTPAVEGKSENVNGESIIPQQSNEETEEATEAIIVNDITPQENKIDSNMKHISPQIVL